MYSQREYQITELIFQIKPYSLLPRGFHMFQQQGIICNYCRNMKRNIGQRSSYVATVQEFLSSVQQLCSVQSGTESPAAHIPHGHHGLSGWTLDLRSVGYQKTTQTNTIVAIRKAHIHINENLYMKSPLTSVPVLIKTLYLLVYLLVCSTMASPDAQPNIKAHLQKTNKDISRSSTSKNILQNIVVLRKTDVKLSRPSLQDVK